MRECGGMRVRGESEGGGVRECGGVREYESEGRE